MKKSLCILEDAYVELMTDATREFRTADIEISSKRPSCKRNSERFSSTLAMASKALAALHIMSTLGGSRGGGCMCMRLCWLCWYWAIVTPSSRKLIKFPMLPFCTAIALAANVSPWARFDRSAMDISRQTGFLRSPTYLTKVA
ncbi:hypothetical protein EK904_009989 [Melospiza melodia maxima]|nr:hypothetical protein EK904_009989 [Melospiza melodia maxima]